MCSLVPPTRRRGFRLPTIGLLLAGALVALPATGVVAAPAAAQEGAETPDRPFARFPDVSPDGRRVAFSYQGDVFTAPVAGGLATRLTLHEAYDGSPRFSPDGERIAFQSDRWGNEDLFVMGADGRGVRRLTHHSADDELGGWTPEGDLLFETRRTWTQVERESEIWRMPGGGGTPDRLLDAVGFAPRTSPDGRFIVFEYGTNGRDRKGYRGPANRDLWLHDTRDGSYAALTGFEGNDMLPAWVGSRSLLFLSERGGTYDLYRLEIDEAGRPAGEPRALTDFSDLGIRSYGASADGGVVVLERGTDLWVLRPGSGEAAGGPPAVESDLTRLELEVPEDDRFYALERRTFRSDADEFAVSPDGEYLAGVVRGEIFVTANDPEEDRAVRVTDHAWRDRDVTWPDGESLLFVSDRSGDYELYRLTSADPEQPDLFLSLRHRVERLTDSEDAVRDPVVSPDGDRVAFVEGRGRLVVAPIGDEGLGPRTVLLDGWATPGDVAWSPDGRWLAYSLDDLDFNAEVWIHAADGSAEPVNVTQHPKADGDPFWSADGSKLGFVSQRNNGDADLWFAWLREEDWEKTKRDWELEKRRRQAREEADGDVGEETEETEEEGDQPIRIDLEGIHERLEQVTSLPGNESDLVISGDGETFFFVTNRSGRQSFDADQDLHRVQWDGTEMKALTTGGASPFAVTLGPEGKRLYFGVEGGRLARIGTDGGDRESLPYAARLEIDHTAEKAQVFDEAWRLLEENFYDPEFHGRDWEALRERYRPWALRASTKRDFRDVFNLMLGELNASHLGLFGPDRAETQEERTGLLGVEVDPVADGVRIERVVPRSPADREASELAVGEVITAVDGRAIAEIGNYWQLLADRVEERTVLTVRDAEGSVREVVIRPTGSLGAELYREWVDDRRELTERYSNGRLGYIHVQGMNWPSFERFERELVASGEGKDGLLVDVRFNGGGWTTDYLLAVLTVRQHAYTVPRGAAPDLDARHTEFRDHYPFGPRLPLAAWTKPVAALANASSFSNAEIFSHAFQHLDLGPLVGEPTFGAVISTGGAGLMDGSFVRLPFRGWYVKATDRNMENGPAVPDVIVEGRPDARADGEDAQLRAAVETLLEGM